MARTSGTPWTIWLAATLAAAFVGWYLIGQPNLRPRQVESSTTQPPAVPSPPALQEVALRAGTSADAPLGAFTIRIDSVANDSAGITVLSETKDTYRFRKAQAGHRLMIPAPDGTYHLDVLRIERNTAYLAMGKQQ
jgi:hypothetical protein